MKKMEKITSGLPPISLPLYYSPYHYPPPSLLSPYYYPNPNFTIFYKFPIHPFYYSSSSTSSLSSCHHSFPLSISIYNNNIFSILRYPFCRVSSSSFVRRSIGSQLLFFSSVLSICYTYNSQFVRVFTLRSRADHVPTCCIIGLPCW